MQLPVSRGPLSAEVLRLLVAGSTADHDTRAFDRSLAAVSDPLTDADLQLALSCCYELHYQGFDSVGSHELEWDPGLIAIRGRLERVFEEALREVVAVPPVRDRRDVSLRLRALVEAADEGPSLSRFLLREASLAHFKDFLIQRSIYQLKEADPHTWQVPRLRGRAKEALVEIQADEYGGGRPGRAHAALFARAMRALDLDDTYGAWWDAAVAETLAGVNLMSLLGLHRRHRGRAVGHLAALEMTSTAPNARYANGLRRLGFGIEATAYFDEHVEADAVHEQVAAVDMCGSLVADEPQLFDDVLWGAAACLALDVRVSTALLKRWSTATHEGAA